MRIRMASLSIVVGLLTLALALMVSTGLAGDPEPPGPPDATTSYTLEDVYQRLDAGTAGARGPFAEPASAPGTGTMHSLDEIMAAAPAADNAAGAVAGQVLSGTTYWSLRTAGGTWGPQTGAMPNNGAVTMVPGTANQIIAAGYHDGTGYVAGDADLTAGNILDGVDIFGVAGAYPPAPVPKTGQTTCWDGTGTAVPCTDTGHDGEHQKGVAWPVPRFVTSPAGVVTDTLTGLVWLQDANCISSTYPLSDTDGTPGDGGVTWQHALDFVAGMTVTGSYSNCAAGFSDWRLPNARELHSLVDFSQLDPALPSGHPFTGVHSLAGNRYWSSTPLLTYPNSAWGVGMKSGCLQHSDKQATYNWVWPVRGGM